MALYGAFSTSVLGMMSQAAALQNIGTNVANVNTGGFKRTDTNFSTVLSNSMQQLSDIGGVKVVNRSTVAQQGNIVSSTSSTDVAISGKGFFVLNTKQDGSGVSLYTRDGSFETASVNDVSVTGIGGAAITVKDGYLVDKNGFFVQGWAYTNGNVTTSGTPSSMRVDQYAFINQFETTTSASINLNLPASDAIGDVSVRDIHLVDSLGTKQNATLNFTKTAINTWSVTTTTSQTSVQQVDTITLGGTMGEVGDIYTITAGGITKTYTTDGTEANIDVIRDNLLAQIVADPLITSSITAAAGATGAISLTAVTPGTSFSSSSTATQGPASVAQVDQVTLAGGIVAGDIYSVTVNGTTLTVTAAGAPLNTLDGLRDNIMNQINADPGLSAVLTASAPGAGILQISSNTAGVPYTLTAATTDAGGAPVNSITPANITPNLTALNDNTAVAATTSANVTPTQTTVATTITFNGDGTINTPASLTLALTFAGGATSTITLDTSDFTQFGGDLTPGNFTRDGFARANMRTFSFDESGNVIGNFEDGTFRSIYKLSLGVFSNPNALDAKNGNVYAASPDSGSVLITSADANGFASFAPNARELSIVDIAEEFTKMMMTQTAYNAASTVFKTTDEMVTVARDLKR
ncbi:MAG: flagellar hook-basal body complex protein [Magnetovibrio sp.]|nr:flagellar hook-basal body complex protein [Magnetovibrio sp.]